MLHLKILASINTEGIEKIKLRTSTWQKSTLLSNACFDDQSRKQAFDSSRVQLTKPFWTWNNVLNFRHFICHLCFFVILHIFRHISCWCHKRNNQLIDSKPPLTTEMKCDQQMCNYYPLPERSKESEVLKIAVRDDKCRGGTTILAGAEVIQGDQLRGSGAGGPAAP